jgi:hypothetical protein
VAVLLFLWSLASDVRMSGRQAGLCTAVRSGNAEVRRGGRPCHGRQGASESTKREDNSGTYSLSFFSYIPRLSTPRKCESVPPVNRQWQRAVPISVSFDRLRMVAHNSP